MKLTEEFIKEFCEEWVAKDLPIEFCCKGIGIHPTTYYSWYSKGEQDLLGNVESLEREFYIKINKTYAKVVKDSVERIKLGRLGWTGEAWMRERRDKEFVKQEDLNVSSENIIINTGIKKNK